MPPRAVSPTATQRSPSSAARAVCPYCALLCDDLALAPRADLGFDVTANGCPRARADFARAPAAAQAFVGGRAVPLERAIGAAARLLERARLPLFAGLASDVDGIRASVNLAERCHAVLDHVHGDTLAAMSRVMQTRGWYATTLSEVRSRADLVVLVDPHMPDRFESFARRCLDPVPGLNGTTARHVAFVGAAANLPRGYAPDSRIACRGEHLTAVMLALLAVLRGRPLDARRPGGATRAQLAALAERMRAARYCALVFTPGSLGAHREPVLGALAEIVDELNRAGRAAFLPLGGDDGGQSALSSCVWLTGFPLRVGFGKTLRYEPQAFASTTLLDTGAVDALLWIDAYGRHPDPPPPTPLERSVLLCASAPAAARECAVYIPIGTPGVDHFARLVRTDTVVTLALAQQRDSGLPSAAGVLTRMCEKL